MVLATRRLRRFSSLVARPRWQILKNNSKKKLTDVAQDAPKTIFLVGDKAGLYLQATTCHVWSPTGQTPIVRADPEEPKRISMEL